MDEENEGYDTGAFYISEGSEGLKLLKCEGRIDEENNLFKIEFKIMATAEWKIKELTK